MDILKKNGIEYLIFAFTDKNKVVLTKYTELWDKIKSLIKRMDNKPRNNIHHVIITK